MGNINQVAPFSEQIISFILKSTYWPAIQCCDWPNTLSVWTEMLRPLPYLEYQLSWWRWHQYYSENKSFA